MSQRFSQLAIVFLSACASTAAAFPPVVNRFEIRFKVDRSQPVEEIYLYLKRKARSACLTPEIWHPVQRKQAILGCANKAVEQVVLTLDWAPLNQYHAQSTREEQPRVIAQTP